jgi:hypothetical protein
MHRLPTGYELMYVSREAIEGIESGDEVIHDGNVFWLVSKDDSGEPNTAVALTVRYERREKLTPPNHDPDWPEIIGESD